jgi:hypothetical protein
MAVAAVVAADMFARLITIGFIIMTVITTIPNVIIWGAVLVVMLVAGKEILH